ncbi:MAG: O-antigen ligase family protein [Bacteroidetes bacterium]|nr:O-antigen ligase family protein [Bacteroidota bacterium]
MLSEVKYFKLLLFILVALAVFLALISLYFFYLNPQLVLLNALSNEARVHGRQAGTIGDPNQFGIMLVFPLLFILSWFLSGIWRNKNKIFQVVVLAGSFLIIFASLLVTYSRSAWLAFLLSGILVFLLFGKIKWLFYSFLVAFLGIIIFSFNSIFVQTLINRVISVTDFSYNVSNSSRIVMAFAGLEMLYDSYFVGFGYRAFQALAPAYYGLEKTQGVTAPHNITIELLANVGIVGCSLFYIFLISVLRKGFRMVKSRSLSKWGEIILICILSYLGALIIFYQLYPNFLHDNFLWFCCGSIWAIDFHNSNFQHKPMLPS